MDEQNVNAEMYLVNFLYKEEREEKMVENPKYSLLLYIYKK